jgi:2-polyprenyl-3-methyl-5-hydroxy-6-metoxy-1,4-benzoquinol methylase
MDATLSDLERQQAALAEVQLDDFRAANLFHLVSERVAPGSVLDVGCGAGGMVAWLLEHGFDARGIDSSEATIRAARGFFRSRRLDPERVTNTSIEDLVAQGFQVDNVVSMDCLEHIENDAAAFEYLVRLARPGGRIVVTVPAMMSLYGEKDRRIGHYRRYEPEQLSRLAAAQGLRVTDLRYWNALGIVPTFLTQRVMRRAVDESFRYGKPSKAVSALRVVLSWWFRNVENRVRPPRGLTLIMTAERC